MFSLGTLLSQHLVFTNLKVLSALLCRGVDHVLIDWSLVIEVNLSPLPLPRESGTGAKSSNTLISWFGLSGS